MQIIVGNFEFECPNVSILKKKNKLIWFDVNS